MAFLQQPPAPPAQEDFDGHHLSPPRERRGPFAGLKSRARSHTLHDGLFLSLIVLLSLVLYLPGLGFYSDDWSLLSYFHLAKDQSLFGLCEAIYSPHVRMRPIQIVYLAGLFKLFGVNPLGYHLVNALVFGAGILLFYFVLRALNQKRLLCVAVPLVYALLPHYSTNRFWFATFNANLSMALFFLSGYAGLRALQTPTLRVGRWSSWQRLSTVSLLGSALAYEVFIPVFLVNLLLFVGYQQRVRAGRGVLIVLLSSNLVALLLALVFKAVATTRMETGPGLTRQIVEIAKQSLSPNYDGYGLNFKRAVEVGLGDWGIGLPRVLWRIARDYPDAAVFFLGAAVGLSVFGYLFHVAGTSEEVAFPPGRWKSGFGVGLAVFVLGYAIFLTNDNLQITSTGMGNRTTIAAALGIALCFVAVVGWLSALAPRPLRNGVFCALVALLCLGGFVVNNTLGTFWAAAYRQEQAVLADIRRQFPVLPTGSTLILDGVCPYVGPAVVFESSWDLAGALRLSYNDRSLRADVVSPSLKVSEDGLYTTAYKGYWYYPYKKLMVYHFGHKTVHPLPDARAARDYLQNVSAGACPPGQVGIGIRVF